MEEIKNHSLSATRFTGQLISVGATILLTLLLGPFALMSGLPGLLLLICICYASIWSVVDALIIKPATKWDDLYYEFKYFKAVVSSDLSAINFNGCRVPLKEVGNGRAFVHSQAYKFYPNNTYLVYDPVLEKSVLVAVEKFISRPLVPALHEAAVLQFRGLGQKNTIPEQGPSDQKHFFYKASKMAIYLFFLVILIFTFMTYSDLYI